MRRARTALTLGEWLRSHHTIENQSEAAILETRFEPLLADHVRSSQHEPEVYVEVARMYPRQMKRILIRDVTCAGPDAPRYQETFKGLSRKLWQIFRDPAEIREALRA